MAFRLSDTTNPIFYPGEERWLEATQAWYKYLYFEDGGGTGSLAIGDAVCYSKDATAAGGYKVDVEGQNSSDQKGLAGIVSGWKQPNDATALTAAGWCWVMTEGKFSDAKVNGAISAGNSLEVKATTIRLQADSTADGAQPTFFNHCVALEANASGNGTIDVHVKCRGN